ncbi:MAG: GNAT family N-acetyltransferase [Thermomicrobiales bacterium]
MTALSSQTNLRSSIEPLRPENLRQLHIGWRARLNLEEIRDSLQRVPGRSVWDPVTHEYAIVSQWRNRDDVLQIADLAAVRDAEAMTIAASERVRSLGSKMTVMVEVDETRRPSFYEHCGFEHIEKVVTFDLEQRNVPRINRPREITFVPADPRDPATMEALLRIDHASFPWIWWNTHREFEIYAVTAGVEIFLGLDGGVPVSYAGFTAFPALGHLDRIAVLPGLQGKGYGLYTLAFVVETMLARGSRKIGLSTQSTNLRSQKLYQRYGFVRTADNDYDLWGDTLHRESPAFTFDESIS